LALGLHSRLYGVVQQDPLTLALATRLLLLVMTALRQE